MLERLHDPDAAGAGVTAEAAGDAFFRIGNILITNICRYFPPGNGIGRAHSLAEMAVTALAAG